MKKILFFGLLMLSFSWLSAQVSGTVYDETNTSTLPGVNIIIKGTTKGTVTDINGNFVISAKAGEVLQFSFMGYEPQEYTVKDKSLIKLYLKESAIQMQEMVVMGYSEKLKTEISSSVVTVDAKDLKDVSSDDLGSMIQGKVSGVQVVNSTGQPGSASQIRIRGVSTIKPGNEEPLYVVDGIIGGTFDPNDIETVTILKDAGATGMYGARANKGVVIVTTKRAKSEVPELTFKTSVGMRMADHGNLDMMNSEEFANTTSELYRDSETHTIDKIRFYQDFPQSLLERDYDWQHESFTRAMTQSYYLSASGRNDKFSYYVSGAYYNEGGTYRDTDYKKINLRANTEYRMTDWFKISNNINIRDSKTNTYDYMDMYYSYLSLPWDNPIDENKKARYVDGTTDDWWSRDNINPYHTIDNSDHWYQDFGVSYDFVAQANIFKWLRFVSSNRMEFSTGKSHDFFSPLTAGAYHGKGYIRESNENWKGFLSSNLFKFNFETGKHTIDGLVGGEIENGYSDDMYLSGKGLPEGYSVPSVASSELAIGGSNDVGYFRSFISQMNYNFDKKYFLTASFRVDATSNFPKNSRIAKFPTISASWLINKESFMEQMDWVNLLRIRSSYGVTGDPDIGSSRYMGLFSLATQYNGHPAAVPSQLRNDDLRWERTNETNLGLDVGLFNRLELNIDVYSHLTNDLIVLRAQPPSTGFEYRWENSGVVTNKGIELGLNYTVIQTNSFTWSLGANFAYNKNRLSGFETPIYNTVSGISQIYRNDGELYTFILPKWLGVDPETGAPQWEKLTKDENGNIVNREPTSDYGEATPQEVGGALPDYIGGINTSIRFKNFELFANFVYQYGNDVYNFTRRFMDHDGHEPFYNYMKPAPDWKRWEKPGDIASHPSMLNAELSRENSSRFLEEGGYFRMNSLSLGYTFSAKIVRKMKLKGLKLNLTANNLFTITNFWGQDPEVNLQKSDWAMPGVSDFKYPINKQFVATIQVKF